MGAEDHNVPIAILTGALCRPIMTETCATNDNDLVRFVYPALRVHVKFSGGPSKASNCFVTYTMLCFPDYNGYSPMLTAVRHRSTRCVELLSEHCKQSPDKKASCGQSPLAEAEKLDEKEIVELLSGMKKMKIGSSQESSEEQPSGESSTQ